MTARYQFPVGAFLQAGAGRPDMTAAVTETGIRVSYAQLATAIDRMVFTLRRSGVQAGSHVILLDLTNLQKLVSFLATARLGAIAVMTRTLLDGIRSIPEPHLIISRGPVPDCPMPNVVYADAVRNAIVSPAPVVPEGFPDATDVAVVLGSSGSTGRGKFVAMSVAHLNQLVVDQMAMLPRPMGRTLLNIPVSLAYGLQMALTVLRQGACIVWTNPEDTLARILDGKVDNIVCAPLDYSRLVEEIRKTAPGGVRLDLCITGGSKISAELADAIRTHICEDFYIQYGSTELGPAAIGHAGRLAEYPDYAGQLQPWVRGWSIDDDGNALAPGTSGRLVFELEAPRSVAPYVKDWQHIGEVKDQRRSYVSEDFGTITADGCVLIESRIQERVNLGGIKLTLQGIKRNVRQRIRIPTDIEAVAITSRHGFDHVFVFIKGSKAAIEANFDRQSLPPAWNEVLTFCFIDRIPQNEFGKADSRRLREMAQDLYDRQARQTRTSDDGHPHKAG